MVRQPLIELVDHPLGIDRVGVNHGQVAKLVARFLDAVADLTLPAAVRLLLEKWKKRLQSGGGIAQQVHLARVAQPEHSGICVDLDATRLSGRGKKFGVREARADNQKRVATLHKIPAGLGAEQTDCSCT